MSWNLNGDFSYSPDAYFGEESYDYFGFPSGSGTLTAQGFDVGFGTKSSGNDLMDWSTTIGTTAPTYTVPLAPPSTTYSSASYLSSPELGSFNDEFISPAALGTETDNESLTSSKRGAEETATVSESTRPSKKQCSSKTSSSPKASTTKAARDKSTSKSKPKASKTSKSASAAAAAAAAPATSGHGGNHNIQLRTASRKPKTSASPKSASPAEEEDDDDEALTNEEKRARQSHNAVEKQYRNRLNMQFERLLAVLPADQQAEARDRHHMKGSGSSVGDADDKRMSKAEVLDMARRRIRALEEERLALQEERKGLIENVSEMQRAVVHQRMQMAARA